MNVQREPSYRSKLKRAKHHLDDLRATFDADGKAGFLRPDVQRQADESGQQVEVTFRVRDDLVIKYSLIAADCVSNLRATLDHLAYALARGRGSTQFPIFATVTEYAEKGVPMLGGIGARAQAAIERLQPYHAGENVEREPLRKLNRMSNIDKHRLLQVVGVRLAGEQNRIVSGLQPPNPRITEGYGSTGMLVDGATKRTFHIPSGVQMQYDFVLHIAFEEIKPSVGSDAIQLLSELLSAVEQVVGLLEPEIPAG